MAKKVVAFLITIFIFGILVILSLIVNINANQYTDYYCNYCENGISGNCSSPRYMVSIWGECINGIQYRNVSNATFCSRIFSLPNNNQSCLSINNTNLETIKTMYNAYFMKYPRVLTFLNNTLINENNNSVYYDYATNKMVYPSYTLQAYWDSFWSYLQQEENNNNTEHLITYKGIYTGTNDYNHMRILAHSIWLDYHNYVPWILNNYSDDNLNYIFKNFNGNSEESFAVYTRSPTEIYSYSKNYIKNYQNDTIIALVNSLDTFAHANGKGNKIFDNNGIEQGDASYVLISPTIDGCEASSELIESLGLNLNIPVIAYANNYEKNWFVIGHGGVIFPGFGYIPHGDSIYYYLNEINSTFIQIIPWDYLQSNIVPLQSDLSYTFGYGENQGEASFIRGSINVSLWNFEIIDFSNPLIYLNNPSDLYKSNKTTINFTCSASDNIKLSNISIYTNISGIFKLNQTKNVTGIYNSTDFNITNIDNGSYIWTCQACDNYSNCVYGSNMTFIINTTNTEDIIYPIFYNKLDNSNSLINSGTGMFNISVNNTNGNVYLSFGGQSIKAINISNIYMVNFSFINNGNYSYYWFSYGNGVYNNINSSDIYYYIVNSNITNNSKYITSNYNLIKGNNYIQNLSFNIDANNQTHLGETFISDKDYHITNIKLYLKRTNIPQQKFWINIVNGTNMSQVLSSSDIHLTNELNDYSNWFNFNINDFNISENSKYAIILETNSSDYVISLGLTSNIDYFNDHYYNFIIVDNADMLFNIYGDEIINNNYSYCYQESSNIINQTGIDGNCNLNYTGSYNILPYYLYINYSKPNNTISALWRLKIGNIENNYSLDYCLNNTIQLRIYNNIDLANGNGTVIAQCYNGTWNNLIQYNDTLSDSTQTQVSGTNTFDGDWDTGSFYSSFDNKWYTSSSSFNSTIYEDGIYWYTLSIQNLSDEPTITIETSVSATNSCSASVSVFVSYVSFLGLIGFVLFFGWIAAYLLGFVNKTSFHNVNMIGGLTTLILIGILIIIGIFIISSLCSIF